MSKTNSRWAKLYTQPDTQMTVTITPSDNGWLVEKQMMINGELNAIVCYDGGDKKYAREVFEEITRDDVATTMQEMISGEVAELPGSPAEVEEVEDTEEDNAPKGNGIVGSSGPDDSGLAGATDAEYDEMTKEEMESAIGSLTEDQLEGWTSCMKKKIVGHYGPEVEACVDGITHGNWEKVLECIVTVLGITDPEVWIPEQIVLFTGWSLECIFGVDSDKD